jgi:hypothetical protein
LAFSAGFAAAGSALAVGVEGVVGAGVPGLDAGLPLVAAAGPLAATMEPKVLTPCGLSVGTAAGEEETGAETSSIEPNVTAEPVCVRVSAWARAVRGGAWHGPCFTARGTATPSLMLTAVPPSVLGRREWETGGPFDEGDGSAGEAARGDGAVGVVAVGVRGDAAAAGGGPFAHADFVGSFCGCAVADLLILRGVLDGRRSDGAASRAY